LIHRPKDIFACSPRRMPHFHYHALNADGQHVTGDIEADGVQQAVYELQGRGLAVQSIALDTSYSAGAPTSGAPALEQSAATARRRDGEPLERTVLNSHMAMILERGHAIVPALRAYAEEMPVGWQRRQLLAVCEILKRGDAAEAAADLANMPECWIPLLSAATVSPDPGQVLRRFLNESRRADELRQKWWLTLAYPLVLAGLATVVMTALSIFVIPEFRAIFAEFGLIVPPLTMFVLGVASFLATWGILLLVIIALVFLLLLLNAYRLLPASTVARVSNWFRLPFARRTAIARFARFTADLLEANVNLADALRIAGFTVNQLRVQRAAWQLANDLELAGRFSPRAYERPLTATVAYALTPEMTSESRVRLLREVSDCHAERVRIGLSWASGIVEPLAIFVVGCVVGLTVLGLFLPLMMLIQHLSK
jgi:type IV pilus assembly protein PilC